MASNSAGVMSSGTMASLFNPLACDLTSSGMDNLLDDVLPAAETTAPAAAATGALVHKDMWDNLLADDPFNHQGPDRGKRDRTAASISSVCSDDLPFRASFTNVTTEDLAGTFHSLDLEQMSAGLGAPGAGAAHRTHEEDIQWLVGFAHGPPVGGSSPGHRSRLLPWPLPVLQWARPPRGVPERRHSRSEGVARPCKLASPMPPGALGGSAAAFAVRRGASC